MGVDQPVVDVAGFEFDRATRVTHGLAGTLEADQRRGGFELQRAGERERIGEDQRDVRVAALVAGGLVMATQCVLRLRPRDALEEQLLCEASALGRRRPASVGRVAVVVNGQPERISSTL